MTDVYGTHTAANVPAADPTQNIAQGTMTKADISGALPAFQRIKTESEYEWRDTSQVYKDASPPTHTSWVHKDASSPTPGYFSDYQPAYEGYGDSGSVDWGKR